MNQSLLLQNGINRQLLFLGRASLMVSILLSPATSDQPEYAIHIDSPTSIVLSGRVIATTDDIDDGPVGSCKFDKVTKNILLSKELYKLEAITIDDMHLLHLYFSNGLEIHSHPVEETDAELWRIFLAWKADGELIAYADGTFEENSGVAQQELDEQRSRKLRRRKSAD